MRFILGVAAALVLAPGCQPAADKSAAPAPSDGKAATTQTPVERGNYLTKVGGCHDCHTPKTLGDINKRLQSYNYEDPYELTQQVTVAANMDANANFDLVLRK